MADVHINRPSFWGLKLCSQFHGRPLPIKVFFFWKGNQHRSFQSVQCALSRRLEVNAVPKKNVKSAVTIAGDVEFVRILKIPQ